MEPGGVVAEILTGTANRYPLCALLRGHAPGHHLSDGSLLLTAVTTSCQDAGYLEAINSSETSQSRTNFP
jgi:hypothetical protein